MTNPILAQRELWGTVSNGGQFGYGYIFKTDATGNNLEIVHHFDLNDGNNPGALLAASGNKLYGLTASGGPVNQGLFSSGVLYEYDLTTSTFRTMQNFGANNPYITGVFPAGDGLRTLTEVSPGLIYGQLRGAYQGGVIFAFNGSNQTISTALTLPTFQGGSTNTTIGNRLEGTLFAAQDGYLYGTTYTNSSCPIANANLGSVIRINPTSNVFSIRYLSPCNGTNGYQFDNQFATYNNKLYSVTKVGGAYNYGVIYSFDPSTNSYTNQYNLEGGSLGYQPSTMVRATNGKFYGTAYGGTPEMGLPTGGGLLFEFDPVNNQFAKKVEFNYGNGFYMNVGTFPFSLIDGNNGNLYGVTANGVFEYSPTLNQTVAKGRFPIDMGWNPPATPSITAVCRKPSYATLNETSGTLCSGSTYELNLQSDNTETTIWYHNGIADLAQQSTLLSIANAAENDAGIWSATLTNQCGTTITPSIHLSFAPEINVVQTANSVEVNSGGDSFQWIDCSTNTMITGANNAVFIPSQSGSYKVVVSNGLCVNTSDCYTLVVLSTNENTLDKGLVLYPNPANNRLFLSCDKQIQSLFLYNALGQILDTKDEAGSINVSGLPRGIYFIVVQTSEGIVKSKFIKK